MWMHSSLIVLGAAALFAADLPFGVQLATKHTPVVRTATIENTGSTNTFGYQIIVTQTGKYYKIIATADGGKPVDALTRHGNPTAVQVQQFFSDLDAAGPLAKLLVCYRRRSASFGTSTFVIYKGQQSPDLQGSGNAHVTALRDDVQALVKTAGVQNTPRRSLRTH